MELRRVNVKPIYLSTKVIVPYWKAKGSEGLFLNMSSVSEPRPRPYVVWYAASKLTGEYWQKTWANRYFAGKGAVTVVGGLLVCMT